MVSACSASCIGTDKIRSITVNLKDHVTSAVDDFCVRVARGVVEKVDSGIVGRFNIGAGTMSLRACIMVLSTARA